METAEKAKTNAQQIKQVHKAAAATIESMLKEQNIEEHEPRVVNQLVEFTFGYVTSMLDDAKIYAQHAGKQRIELDDVRLAQEQQRRRSELPTTEQLAKLAESINAKPLPAIKPHCGQRLPPAHCCLTGVNYKLRAANPPPKKMPKSALRTHLANASNGAAKLQLQLKQEAAAMKMGSGSFAFVRKEVNNNKK
ncbi:e-y-1 [Drosophila busckii]|uniref:E-y-1 n=1 Tax=Drosophila busckii TaxID=30019 RepID=A0A0M3QZ38_DROBS|nr:transcription initiation factor TFIID subunit 9 [Drosophila busckii]ALC48753.1 e-y-1 [Drosophila busckii]